MRCVLSVYGRIDLGNYPPPALVYPQPVVIAPTPVAVYQQPIYLYVPGVYQQNWGHYCGRYNACGQPVYFVQEQRVRERHRHGYESSYRRGNDEKGPSIKGFTESRRPWSASKAKA